MRHRQESNPGPSDSETASESSSSGAPLSASSADKDFTPINPNKPNPLTWKVGVASLGSDFPDENNNDNYKLMFMMGIGTKAVGQCLEIL